MNELTIFALFREAFLTAAIVGAPVLITALVVGVAVSVFQAVTQIQEMTLTFIPKIIGVSIALLVFGPMALSALMRFSSRLLTNLPKLVGA